MPWPDWLDVGVGLGQRWLPKKEGRMLHVKQLSKISLIHPEALRSLSKAQASCMEHC